MFYTSALATTMMMHFLVTIIMSYVNSVNLDPLNTLSVVIYRQYGHTFNSIQTMYIIFMSFNVIAWGFFLFRAYRPTRELCTQISLYEFDC